MLDAVRNSINPPYNFKDFFVIFILLFLLLILPIIVLETPKQGGLKGFVLVSDETEQKIFTTRIVNPTPGNTVQGLIKVAVSAETDEVVEELQVLVDNNPVNLSKNAGFQKNSLQTSFELNSADFSNGEHQISAVATSASGRTSQETIKVNFDNPADNEPPTVNFINPNTGEKLSGRVKVILAATDNRAVATLNLLIDGNMVFSKPTANYTYLWDLDSLPAGNHTLLAKATDLAGNSADRAIQIYHSAAALIH